MTNRCNTCSSLLARLFSSHSASSSQFRHLAFFSPFPSLLPSTYNIQAQLNSIRTIREHNNSSLRIFLQDNVINVSPLLLLSFAEYAFMQSLPSVLASACVCAATRGINSPSARRALGDVVRLTRADPLEVEFAVRHIEIIVAKQAAAMQQQHQEQLKMQYQSNKLPTTCSTEVYQSGTGSDFKDVYF